MTADEIVRKLAKADWVYDYIVCFFCKSAVRLVTPGAETDAEMFAVDEPHDEDCPYALALAYVEANPV